MKYLFTLLLLAPGFHVIAQATDSKHFLPPRTVIVNVRNLKPAPIIDKLAGSQKDQSANEEEHEPDERQLSKKNKQLTSKQAFPVTTVTPLLNGASADQPTLNGIYETPCLTYPGLTQAGFIPPDVSGAVGFDELFLNTNDQFQIKDKYGALIYQQSQQDPNGFWAGPGATNLFDPKIFFDPYQHRWVFVILKNGGSSTQPQNNAILVAVSQTADPMGNWFQWQIDGDPENDQWFDFPSIGFNRNWLVINGNLFNIGATGSTDTRTFVFNINNLYTNTLSGYTVFTTTNYNTICPALTYDPNTNDLWCVTNDDVDDNDLRFFKISGTANSPSMTEEGYISVGSNWGQGRTDIGPQLGNSAKINTGNHRVLSVVWRDGHLYSAQTIFLPSGQDPADRCTIQFVSADPVNEVVHEGIRFSASNISMYAFPCMTVNNKGDIIISCSKFTAGTYPSAVVLVRRNNSSFVETNFKPGLDWYVNYDNSSPARNRWGDYTTAMLDPSDDNSVWVASEYSINKAAGNVGQWGTWWAKMCSGICKPIVYFTDILNNGDMVKYEAGETLYGIGVVNAGASVKLDAGTRVVLSSGFRANNGARVRTFIEGCGGAQ